MTRRNKLIILAVYLLLLTLALPIYRAKRNAANKRLQAELAQLESQKNKISNAGKEMEGLKRLFPAEAETGTFIESLYSAAKLSGLTSHEVTTHAATSARTAARGGTTREELAAHRLQIAAEAVTYRALAEYFRRVQNIERFKRFTAFKLTSTKTGIAATASLELFSLKEEHGR